MFVKCVLQDADNIINEFEDLRVEVEKHYNQSVEYTLAANSNLTTAQQRQNDTNQVTVQELLSELISCIFTHRGTYNSF